MSHAYTLRPWSAAEDATLAAMCPTASIYAIGQTIGRSPKGVKARLYKLGIGPYAAKGEATRAELARLAGEGVAAPVIARRLGLARKAVKAFIGERDRPKYPARTHRIPGLRRPRSATTAAPGSREKVAVMAARLRRGERPNHPDDPRLMHATGTGMCRLPFGMGGWR